MAKSYELGMNAKAFFQVPAVADPSLLDPRTGGGMTELSNIQDVTLNHETGEADITTRANQGWRATAATLKECSADFKMLWKPGDTGFEAIRNAWLNSTEISMAFISGNPNEEDSEGPMGNFSVTNFSRSEPLEEALTVDVTVKLSKWGAWFSS